MTTSDPDRARSRLLFATQRFIDGARLQRDRLEDRLSSAPHLLEGGPHGMINLTGLPTSDLDYYTYELVRLQDAAGTVIKVLGSPQEIVDALATFPRLRETRNPLTYASDDERLNHVAWLGSIERLLPGGNVETLVDPRDHHDAAEALASALIDYLRSGIRNWVRQPA